MRNHQYQCGICGYRFMPPSKKPASFKPACSECGEMNRLIALPKESRRFLPGFLRKTQTMSIDRGIASDSPQHYIRRNAGGTGCSRIPTCCGLATPCDAPPSYCEEHGVNRRLNNNRRSFQLPR